MKISEHFNLGKSQYELNFIDIDTERDIPLFIDPHLLAQKTDNWSLNATKSIKSFFQHFINLLRINNTQEAKELFSHLHEPNETHLGLSQGESSGRGIGSGDTDKIYNSLLKSKAIQSGLIEDIEDTRIFVEGIGKDKLSDMVTNIIRKHLIEYTVNQAKLWDIPLMQNIPVGDIWNSSDKVWENSLGEALVIGDKKALLVPKHSVSYSEKYTPKQYYNHFVLNFLQNEELRLNGALVQNRKNGDKFVTKKDIKEQNPYSKELLAKFTEKHPEVFQNFKNIDRTNSEKTNELLNTEFINDVINHLITKLQDTPTGAENANIYHKTVVGILELLFYPYITNPIMEKEIHSGRKRVDIIFDNSANKDFFFNLHQIYKIPSSFIFVECKNYSKDVKNPELDQLSGRFSVNRGKFGFITSRTIDNMDKFLDRCSDTYKDDRGLILPLVDDDLINLLKKRKVTNEEDFPNIINSFLMDRFRRIALS
jgi:hypothetical protein